MMFKHLRSGTHEPQCGIGAGTGLTGTNYMNVGPDCGLSSSRGERLLEEMKIEAETGGRGSMVASQHLLNSHPPLQYVPTSHIWPRQKAETCFPRLSGS